MRGVVAFISSLIVGNKVLLRSAAVAEEEDETPSKAEKWLAEKHKIDLSGIFNFISVLLGIVLAVGLFVALPQWVTGLTNLSRTEPRRNSVQPCGRRRAHRYFYFVSCTDFAGAVAQARIYVPRSGT